MKAVICGAGISGLTLARQLSTHGWEVVVLEKAPGPRTQGYMIDFFGAGYDAAEAMGVLPRMRELGYRVVEARFIDTSGRQRAKLGFEQFIRGTGDQMMSIMRPDIELALRDSLPDAVEIRYATTLTDIDNGTDRVRITLSSGRMLDADLLVGADGIHSAVRNLVFGPEQNFLRYLGFHTAAYTFRDPAIHARMGDTACLTDSVDQQMGLYGLRDGRVATFAVHRTPDPTIPADPVATLHARYASLGWVIPDVLAQCPPASEVYYDQVAQIVMPHWHQGRVVLVGDACYAVSLLAGQGASLGIAGAYVLAEQLHHARSIRDGLDRYEQLWRPVAEEKQLSGRKAARWFLPRSTTALRLRRAMLAMTAVPGINHLVVGSLAGKQTAVIKQLRHQSDQTGTHAWR
jgi:2-polyprenyl-6-methoxyphenol hydroxylase-like FAD-dependent oxidoreductase